MEAAKIYVIFWACALGALFVYKCPKRLVMPLWLPVSRRLPDSVRYGPCRFLRLPCRTLYFWHYLRVTVNHYVLVLIYILGNGLLFVRPEVSNGFRIVKASSEETQKRAVIAAVTNLVPVTLGGQTCFLADAINIPLQQYYFVHHWLARIAVAQILIHVGYHARNGIVWTAHTVFGLIVSVVPKF